MKQRCEVMSHAMLMDAIMLYSWCRNVASSKLEAIRPLLLNWSICVAALPAFRLHEWDWTQPSFGVGFAQGLIMNLILIYISNMLMQSSRWRWVDESVHIPNRSIGRTSIGEEVRW